MVRIQRNHPPSPWLLSGAVLVAGLGFWKNYKLAYVGSAGLTTVAIARMFRAPTLVRTPVPPASAVILDPPPVGEIGAEEAPAPTPLVSSAGAAEAPAPTPLVSSAGAAEAPAPRPTPASSVSSTALNQRVVEWAEKNGVSFNDLLQACQAVGQGEHGVVFSGESRWPSLGYAVGERRPRMGYIWRMGNGPTKAGAIKEGQYPGIRFDRDTLFIHGGKGTPITPLMVGISTWSPRDVKAIKLMTQLRAALSRDKRQHLLIPEEQFLRRRQTAVALPTVKFDGDLAHTSMTWQQTVNVIADVAKGLKYLHAAGFSHNDLHPGNIVHKEKAFGAIIDWDFLHYKHSSEPGSVGHVWCTPPEAWRNGLSQSAGEAVDLWSLGVVMYAVFFGRPLEGEHWADRKFLGHRKKLMSVRRQFYPPMHVVYGPRHGNQSRRGRDERWRVFERGFCMGAFPQKGPTGLKRITDLTVALLSNDPNKRPKASEVLICLKQIQRDLKAL